MGDRMLLYLYKYSTQNGWVCEHIPVTVNAYRGGYEIDSKSFISFVRFDSLGDPFGQGKHASVFLEFPDTKRAIKILSDYLNERGLTA